MRTNQQNETKIADFPWKAVGDTDQMCHVTIDEAKKLVYITTDEPAGNERWFAFHDDEIPIIIAALKLAKQGLISTNHR